MIPIITIDGPVSSGKGTVARLVAARLAWHLLDSGALYRVLGLYATRQGVALDDQPALIRLAENANSVAEAIAHAARAKVVPLTPKITPAADGMVFSIPKNMGYSLTEFTQEKSLI